MGQALATLIKTVNDTEKGAQDVLNALLALGESRVDAAQVQATSDATKTPVPLQKILLKRQAVLANANTNTGEIAQGVKGAVGNLIKGQILDGVVDIIANSLEQVLDNSAGQISQTSRFALTATDLGALLRIDIDVYSIEVHSKEIQDYTTDMTAITSIISTIDSYNLNTSDLRSIVSTSYADSPTERQKQIFELLNAAWENDRKVAVGRSVTSSDQERFQSLMKPSVHDTQRNVGSADEKPPAYKA